MSFGLLKKRFGVCFKSPNSFYKTFRRFFNEIRIV